MPLLPLFIPSLLSLLVLFSGCGGDVDNVIDSIKDSIKKDMKITGLSAPEYMVEMSSSTISVLTNENNSSIVSVIWSASEGDIENPNSITTKFTAPSVTSQKDITIKATACNQDRKCATSQKIVTVVPSSMDNKPPTIHSISISGTEVLEEESFPIGAIVTDLDSENLIYQWSAQKGSFEDATVLETKYIAPQLFGENEDDTITLVVSDGKQTNSQSVFITILDSSAEYRNNAPTIEGVNHPAEMFLDENISLSALAYDRDGDTLSYFWSVDRGTIDNLSSKDITYAPPARLDSIAVANFELRVCDDKNLCTTKSDIKITINTDPQISNNAPIIESVNYPKETHKDEPIALSALAYDKDDDNISYFWKVDRGTIDNLSSKDIVYTPPTNLDGQIVAKFELTVCDIKNLCTTKSDIEVIIGVTSPPQNTPPVIEKINHPIEIREDEPISLKTLIYDVDGDELTYFWSVDRGTINDITAKDITYTPPPLNGLSLTVRFELIVCDGKVCISKDDILMKINPTFGMPVPIVQ